MPLSRGLFGPSPTTPSFFTSGWQRKSNASPGDTSFGSMSKYMQTQSWHSEELAPPEGEKEDAVLLEKKMQPEPQREQQQRPLSSSPGSMTPADALRREAATDSLSCSPCFAALSSPSAATPAANSTPLHYNQHAWVNTAAVAVHAEAYDADSMENSLSCDGADARYVEVVNERAFSALKLRGTANNQHDNNTNTSSSYGFRYVDTVMFGSTPPPTTPSQQQQQQQQQQRHLRGGATSATLTPVTTRVSHTGTPAPAHLHTPLHSTAYGSNCYNRLLSSALLGGPEGRRSSVFTLSARSTPPARVSQKLTQRSAPAAGSATTAGGMATAAAHMAGKIDEDGLLSTPSQQHPSTLSEGVASLTPPTQALTVAKPYTVADSTLDSLCSSPHPLTLGESKGEDEEGDDDEGCVRSNRLANARNFQIHQQQQQQLHPVPLQQQPHGTEHSVGHAHPIVSPNGQTPSVASPISYFQNAPLVWTHTNSPGLRLRYQEGSDSGGLFDSAGDSVHSTDNSQAHAAPPPHVPPQMRTAGVVPNAKPYSPFTVNSPPAPFTTTAGSFASTSITATAGAAQYDTPLFAPSDPMHAMARMVSGSCTPPSLRDSNTELAAQQLHGAPAGMEEDEDVVAPTSPLHFPRSVTRHPGFCTPSVSRPTFVLPPSTARAASPVAAAGANRGSCHDDSVLHSSCATPVPLNAENSPTDTRAFYGADGGGSAGLSECNDLQQTPTRALFAVRASPMRDGALERSLRSSPSSLGRPLRPSPHVLLTPVHHHDNAIRDFAPHHARHLPRHSALSQNHNRNTNNNSSNTSLSTFGGVSVGSVHLPRHDSGPLSVSPATTSPATRFPTTPVQSTTATTPTTASAASAVPVALSPARPDLASHGTGVRVPAAAFRTATTTPTSASVTAFTTLYGEAALEQGDVVHQTPYRDASLASAMTTLPAAVAAALGPAGHRSLLRRSSTATSAAATTAGAAVTARRDTFHFVRAMTASETSTDLLRSPFFWGCFGVLVAQGAEVWCVGKAQPFRIYPQDAAAAAMAAVQSAGRCPRERAPAAPPATATTASITAVASTAVVSAATWDEAAVSGAASGNANVSLGAVVHEMAYLAVGTSEGDVHVYAYARCAAAAAGAVAVYPSDPSPSPHRPQQQTTTYAVKLQRFGTLKCASRVGETERTASLDEDGNGGSNIRHHRTSSAHMLRDDAQPSRHAVSVLRVVGPWLYIGDQSGHVSRYDLRHTVFLQTAEEAAAAACASGRQGSAHLQTPTTATATALVARLAPEASASTPARVLASPNPRMPVHNFGRPSATPTAKTAPAAVAVAATSTTTTTTTDSSTPPGSTTAPSPTCFHFAVHAGEPVYNLEVTDNHAYVAVGTQTRLLVYRVADMPRFADSAAFPASPSLSHATPCRNPHASMLAATPPSARASASIAPAVARTPFDDATVHDVTAAVPLVVVCDAPQPIRCFAWMLCDYEALASAQATSSACQDEAAGFESICGATGGATSGAFASFSHTPTPSLVFASAIYDDTVCDSGSAAGAFARFKSVVQLFRVVSQSVAASCTLDYPVRVLRVITGTSRIIVGTGGLAEWPTAPPPSQLPPGLSLSSAWSASPSLSASASLAVTPVREAAAPLDGGFSARELNFTSTPLPLPFGQPQAPPASAAVVLDARARSDAPHGYHARSQSAATVAAPTAIATPTSTAATAALSPTLSRSPAPVPLRRRSTPAGSAAALTALRTLTGAAPRRASAGLWYANTPTTAGPRLMTGTTTRMSNTAMRSTLRHSASPNRHNSSHTHATGMTGGGAGGAQHVMTPDAAAAVTPLHRGHAGQRRGSEHGFLFTFEVCPCAVEEDTDVEDGEAGYVCLRARGEAVIGEGESAVSGFLSPTNDQLSVLVQLTNPTERRTDAASALAVKVKVWNVSSGCCGTSGASPVRQLPVSHMPSFSAMAPLMESLR